MSTDEISGLRDITQLKTNSTFELPADCFRYTHEVGVTFWLSRSDIERLIYCAKTSHDGTCVAAGLRRAEKGINNPTTNGFLAMFQMRLGAPERDERTPVFVDQRQIGIMLKILEVTPPEMKTIPFMAEWREEMNKRLRQVMHGINEESKRLERDQPNHIFDVYL